jgi:hypothetical protein
METTIRTKQYGGEIILPNLTSEAGAKTYGPPCNTSFPREESSIMMKPPKDGEAIDNNDRVWKSFSPAFVSLLTSYLVDNVIL